MERNLERPEKNTNDTDHFTKEDVYKLVSDLQTLMTSSEFLNYAAKEAFFGDIQRQVAELQYLYDIDKIDSEMSEIQGKLSDPQIDDIQKMILAMQYKCLEMQRELKSNPNLNESSTSELQNDVHSILQK
jgi:hypothetical protein